VNILFSSKLGIGQHRVGAVGGGNSGQRQGRDPAAVVGQGSGGEEHSQDHGVPGSKADSMVDMTHGAENAPSYDRVVRRKGDCK
jgi:hypothetical protein